MCFKPRLLRDKETDRVHITHHISQCLTLAPVVRLQARIANAEEKEWLANCLFYLRQAPTGTPEGDITKLAGLIEGYVCDTSSILPIICTRGRDD